MNERSSALLLFWPNHAHPFSPTLLGSPPLAGGLALLPSWEGDPTVTEDTCPFLLILCFSVGLISLAP